MGKKILNIEFTDKKNLCCIEQEDVLALKVSEFATKNDLTILEAVKILEYQTALAEGKLVGEGLKIFATEFEKITKSTSNIEKIFRKVARYILDGELSPAQSERDWKSNY